MNSSAGSRLGLLLSVIGLFLFLYIFIAIIILGDILYNPLTNSYIPLVMAVPFAAYLNGFNTPLQQIPGQLLVGDVLLFVGIILAVSGSLLYYISKTKNIRYALGKMLFNYSVLIALLIFIPVFVLAMSISMIYNIPAYKAGFPEWTSSVTTSTCFVKMANWSVFAPYCYFVNYGEIFAASLLTAGIGFYMFRKAPYTTQKPRKEFVDRDRTMA